MMSNFYRSVNPSFWSGKTGKFLRGNHKAQILALYLITNQHTNMQGVYHLPIAYICADTGLTHEGALKGLESLFKGGFCEYFYDEEVVFIYKMLAFQTGNLKKTDNRAISVCNFYAQLEEGQIKQRFAEHYWELLGFENKPLASLLEAPRVSVAVSVTETETDEQPKVAGVLPKRFNEFWDAYDKKKGKSNAVNVWKALKPNDELIDLIVKKAKQQASVIDTQFRKDPERWLKGKHWEDEIISEPAGKSTEELERMIFG